MPVIEARGVTHRYGEHTGARTVLADVELRISEQRVGIVGANGSGKSTFARMVNGLVLPSAGTVTVDGLDTRTTGPRGAPPGRVLLHRPRRADRDADGRRGRRVRAAPPRAVQARGPRRAWTAALAAYGLDGHADHPAHLLSGGQKQLLALASVLVTEPDVLVMDEPTTLLDLRNATMISRVVADLPAAGAAGHPPPRPARRLRPGAGLRRAAGWSATTPPPSAVTFYRKLMA